MFFILLVAIKASGAAVLLEFQSFTVMAAEYADLLFRENAKYLLGEGIHFNVSLRLVYFL